MRLWSLGPPPCTRRLLMSSQVLVLTQQYQPHKIISWQRAITLMFGDKVEVLETYDEEISSVSITIKMPSVIRLLRAVRGSKRVVKFSRINILTRDQFRCQYCGQKFEMKALSYDHVVPRSQGGRTTWENVVVACTPCNSRKGDRTPERAGMKLRTRPAKPTSLPISMLRFDRRDVHDTWATYVFWKGELEHGS
jgi:5-methylcytosine-specific restriction endonuclease McrA